VSARPWLAAGLCALAAACGYSTGIRMPDGIESVGVEVFGNDSKLRDLEVELQSALVDAMERLVHAPLVDPGRADLVLRGRVVDYARRGGIRSAQNVRLETGVRIAVEAQLVRRGLPEDALAPEPAAGPAGRPAPASDRDSTPPTAPGERVLDRLRLGQEFGFVLSETQGEARARQRTLRNLADRIVLDLLGGLSGDASP